MNHIDEAIDFIKQHEPPEGYFVGFSGGKDSIVTLDLVRRSGVKHEAFYSMTLIDPPEVVAFINKHYPDVKKLKPDMTFWQGCLKNDMPLSNQRWCCNVLKHNTKSLKAIPMKSRLLGIRAKESWKRAKRERIEKHKDITKLKPIFAWTQDDIWNYIKDNNLPYPELYDKGFKRLGCICCPMDKSIKNNALKRQYWPNFYKLLDIYLDKLWQQDKERLVTEYYFTEEEFKKWPIWKSKKERKQMKFDYEGDVR